MRRAARRRRADHAVELPGRHSRVEGGAGARLREHRRHEARAGGAADGPPSRGVLRRGGHARPASSTSSSVAARRSARRSSRTRRCGRSRSPARSPVGELVRERGDSARQARAARARRPQPADRDGRRRPRPRRRGRLRRCLLVGRPEVHRHAPHLRRGLRRTTMSGSGCSSEMAARRRRRPDRPRRRRSARSSTRRSSTEVLDGHRAREGRRRHATGGRRAARRGGVPPRAGALRGARRRRVPLLRGGVRAGHVALLASPSLDEALRASERRPLRAVGGDLHVEPRVGADVRRRRSRPASCA